MIWFQNQNYWKISTDVSIRRQFQESNTGSYNCRNIFLKINTLTSMMHLLPPPTSIFFFKFINDDPLFPLIRRTNIHSLCLILTYYQLLVKIDSTFNTNFLFQIANKLSIHRCGNKVSHQSQFFSFFHFLATTKVANLKYENGKKCIPASAKTKCFQHEEQKRKI